DFVIIGRHILPNVLHVILITSILQFSGLVMVEAILAYIRIGVPSTVESWGRIVDGARAQLGRDPIIWWPVLGAFFFMFLLVLSINVFGDALRDALDPKLRS
ncbi:ABC transporter permease subunit, partial [bacterium]|nr:ABC transporter permease subunit [bacterium]